MTPGKLQEAKTALESLRPRGQTNVWGGILEGMETLSSSDDGVYRLKTLMLLTDGKPNISPPRGHLRELQAYKDKHPGFSCQINTFGFGYDLDSDLLLDLAMESSGTFAFIPDAPIVGTTFVDSISNVLSTYTQNATLHLTPANGAAFTGEVLGKHAAQEVSWGLAVSLGPLSFGQTRDIVVPMHIPEGDAPYLECFL